MSRFDDGAMFAGDFLEHFGIKGMRWGVRRNSGSGSHDRTSGHKNDDDSEDFTRTADIAVRAKKSGIRTLSNKELRDLVDRINLEQNFSRINTPEAKKTNPLKAGAQYVGKKLNKTADMTVDAILKTAVQIKVQEEVKKKLAPRVVES